jgi:SNF2 family DNA or RNA helicase
MKTQPMSQQKSALAHLEGKRNFALIMEMGTGKTWTALADAERCYLGNKIDAVLILAPKGVHTNWIRREIPMHLEVETICYEWKGNPTTKKAKAGLDRLYTRFGDTEHAPLRIFAINIDAIITKSGFEAALEFLKCFRVMMIVDESTRIKNPKAKRSQQVIKLGKLATARRILTGAPITKGPLDLFNQFEFLKSGLLGTTSYRAFVSEYAHLLPPDDPRMLAIVAKAGPKAAYAQVVETDRFGNKQWKNLDKLSRLIAPHSYRVRKVDCLDLPPKVYKNVFFELEPKQRAIYDRLRDQYHYIDFKNSRELSFEAIATLTKLKQVTSGYMNVDGTPQLVSPEDNPRMAAFKEVIEDIEEGQQFIVWAMYKEEIRQVVAALRAAGISAVEFHGETAAEDRVTAVDDFQAGRVQAFVGHAQAGGLGLTLTAANLAIYYSCSYDNELRLQSEDRCHRIGTKDSVLYIDILAEETIDEDIAQSLREKTRVAALVIDGVVQ